jgi:CheY-like chemotaxis protein
MSIQELPLDRVQVMESLGEKSVPHGRAGWTLLHRIGRLFRTPGVLVGGLSVAGIRVATDELPAGLCVLVADDNPVNLMVVSEMLGCLGVRSLPAADGAEAVALAAKTRLDLILMDLQMPVLDGLGASRQIRRLEQATLRARVPVVAYTSLRANRRQLLEHGIDDVLEKPCELREMRECLLRWCAPEGTTEDGFEAAACPGK